MAGAGVFDGGHVQLEKSIVLSPPSLLTGTGSSEAGMGSARGAGAVPVSPESDGSGDVGPTATVVFPNGKSSPNGKPGSCVGSSSLGNGSGVGVG